MCVSSSYLYCELRTTTEPDHKTALLELTPEHSPNHSEITRVFYLLINYSIIKKILNTL